MDREEVMSIVVDGVNELGATEMIQMENRDESWKKRPREWEFQELSAGNVTVSSIEDSLTVEGKGFEETQVKDGLIIAEFSENPKKVCGLDGNSGDENLDLSVDKNLKEIVNSEVNLGETVNSEVNLGETGCSNGRFYGNDAIRSTEEEIPKRGNDLNLNSSYQEGTQTKESMVDENSKVIDSVGTFEVVEEKGGISLDENVKGDDALLDRDVEIENDRDVEIENEDVDLGGTSKANDSSVLKTTQIEYNVTAGYCSTPSSSVDQSGLGSRDKDAQSRKKRKMTSEKEVVLRRSSRRTNSAYSLNNVSKTEESSAIRTVSLSRKTKVLSDEILAGSSPERFEGENFLPTKLELPPSSKNLNLEEIPIFDICSIYSILRSFSTILFLSPFELEAFVVALTSKFPNSLIDSVHVSILQTLKRQLKHLSNEGSQSASDCLRSLNWELLDLITWPVYMVEYLLIHCSGWKPRFQPSCVKLLDSDYYGQPLNVKVELLQCLCEDLLESEVITSELDRRVLAFEHDIDVDCISKSKTPKKRKGSRDELGGSYLTQEIVDETNDWNSDECCLCKMDGSLICCDGCPAAYHSRCVGIIKDLLPEGDWYCPECVMEKRDPSMKSRKSIRGAEPLGTDPFGRTFFCSYGYLLVSDSSETGTSNYYYHRDDLDVVIETLKSSPVIYSGIINSVTKMRNNSGPKGSSDHRTPTMHTYLDVKGRLSSAVLSSLPNPLSNVDEAKVSNESKPSESFAATKGLENQSCKSLCSVRRSDSATVNQFMEMASPFASSEGSTEISLIGTQTSSKNGANCSLISAMTHTQIETLQNTDSNASEYSLRPNAKQTNEIVTSVSVNTSKGTESSFIQSEHDHYFNRYSFARIAASVGGELMSKSTDGISEDPKRSDEDIVIAQMKAISNMVSSFCWSNNQRLHMGGGQESCGWCFFCKNPTDGEDCLFRVTDKLSSEVCDIGSSVTKKESHLTTIIHQILSIEERLFGLLSGPWHNPHYRMHWRKSVLEASNVASLKHHLLAIESNLRRVAMSEEWFKVVDSLVTLGSASHAMTKGQVSPLKQQGIARKRAKVSLTGPTATSSSAGPSGIFWWRGGRLSRQLFNCKVLPCSMAAKVGRQGGCGKITTLLYLENSEFARRIRYIEWRASVEMSRSVTQLACRIREFDMNIRWDSIENTQHLSRLDKEYKKLWRLFKKVSIRRKSVEGTQVKYLLDFGKRRTMPEPVIRHGVMLELSASERKKYWLDESHVPLNLQKAFEEKKLVRMASKTKPGLPRGEAGIFIRKPPRKRGLSYLLSKSENHQCGQCNKDVLTSEAVNCKDCKGFFHRKHFRKSKGANTSDSTYSCDKCQNKKNVKMPVKLKKKVKMGKKKATSIKGKPQAQEKIISKRGRPAKQEKISSIAGRLRRSVRKVNYAELENKQLGQNKKYKLSPSKKVITKKRKRGRPKKVITKKPKLDQSKKGITEQMVCLRKGKRKRVSSPFWLNGLLLTRQPNDDAHLTCLREGKLLMPSEQLDALSTQPICCLCCETGYASTLVYVRCGKCEEWYHGDAVGINEENIGNVLGFRCHNCRQKSPSICPHKDPTVSGGRNAEKSNAVGEPAKGVADSNKFPNGKEEGNRAPSNEGTRGSFHMYTRKLRSDSYPHIDCEDQKTCEVPDSNSTEPEKDKTSLSDQIPALSESKDESTKGLEFVPDEQNLCLNSDQKDQKADRTLDSDHNPSLEAIGNDKENGHIVSV